MDLRQMSPLALVLSLGLAAEGRAADSPAIRTSDVLDALVQPVSAMDWHRLDIDQGKVSIVATATDPSANLQTISALPLLTHAQWTERSVVDAAAQTREIVLTADVVHWQDPSAPSASSKASGKTVWNPIARQNFEREQCTLVSELQIPTGALMSRWRCATDLRGITRLVSALEAPASGFEVSDVGVFTSSALVDGKPTLDMKMTVAPSQPN